MAFIVVYDASALYPSTLCDLAIRLAQSGLVQARWTEEILDEVFGTLRRNRPDLDATALERTRELMVRAVRDCLIVGYEPLVAAVQLPDPQDRHVLAAAIRSRARVIVTTNLKDFPAHVLDEWNVEAKHPDAFVLDQIDLDRQAVHTAMQRIADAWRNPPGRSRTCSTASSATASSSPQQHSGADCHPAHQDHRARCVPDRRARVRFPADGHGNDPSADLQFCTSTNVSGPSRHRGGDVLVDHRGALNGCPGHEHG